MRLLFLGDIVGKGAREAICQIMPELRIQKNLDFVIVNGENAAGGFGITKKIALSLYDSGVDAITLGNHAWDQKDILGYIDDENRLIRPCNYPSGTAGRGASLLESSRGHQVLVINVMGKIHMESLDDPFSCIERELTACHMGDTADAIIVDIHAEASSEKMAMGHFCDGKVSLVVGTHTHVPTADLQILSNGTAYQTDAGMCGDYDSVIGMDKTEPIQRFLTKMRRERFSPAQGEVTLCGVFVETDDKTGLAMKAQPFRKGGCLAQFTDIG